MEKAILPQAGNAQPCPAPWPGALILRKSGEQSEGQKQQQRKCKLKCEKKTRKKTSKYSPIVINFDQAQVGFESRV